MVWSDILQPWRIPPPACGILTPLRYIGEGAMGSDRGIGASLPRKEDHRLLHGRGEFVADIAMPGTMDVAFVRSPLAHARMAGLTKPGGP